MQVRRLLPVLSAPPVSEAGAFRQVHRVDLRIAAGVLRGPDEAPAVGCERDRGEPSSSLGEDEPHRIGSLVRRQPDRLLAAPVDHEREREPARVVRDLEVTPAGQRGECLDMPVVDEAFPGRTFVACGVDDREPDRMTPVERGRPCVDPRKCRCLARHATDLQVCQEHAIALRSPCERPWVAYVEHAREALALGIERPRPAQSDERDRLAAGRGSPVAPSRELCTRRERRDRRGG